MSDTEKKNKKSKKTEEAEVDSEKKKKEEDSDNEDVKPKKKDDEKPKKDKKKDKKEESESESDDDKKGKKSSSGKKKKKDYPWMENNIFYCKEASNDYKGYFLNAALHQIEKIRATAPECEKDDRCSPEEFMTFDIAHKKWADDKSSKSKRRFTALFTVNAEAAEIIHGVVAEIVYIFKECESDIKTTDDTEKAIGEVSDAAKLKFKPGNIVSFAVDILKANGLYPLNGDAEKGYSLEDLNLMDFHKDFRKNIKKEFTDVKAAIDPICHLVLRFLYLWARPLAQLRWFSKYAINANGVGYALTVIAGNHAELGAWRQEFHNRLAPMRAEADKKKKKRTSGTRGKKDKDAKPKKKKSSKKKKDESDEDSENSDDDADSDSDSD